MYGYESSEKLSLQLAVKYFAVYKVNISSKLKWLSQLKTYAIPNLIKIYQIVLILSY
jgi:hypothetical protein